MTRIGLAATAAYLPERWMTAAEDATASGIPEQVIEGQSGVFYQPGDTGKLAEHIGALGSDAELRRKLGRGARLRLEAMMFFARAISSALISFID